MFWWSRTQFICIGIRVVVGESGKYELGQRRATGAGGLPVGPDVAEESHIARAQRSKTNAVRARRVAKI